MWDTILKSIIGVYFGEKMLKKHNMNRALKNPKFKKMIQSTASTLKKNDELLKQFQKDMDAVIDKM
mgnify:CR=1 FL=1|jgi:hypothetical protein